MARAGYYPALLQELGAGGEMNGGERESIHVWTVHRQCKGQSEGWAEERASREGICVKYVYILAARMDTVCVPCVHAVRV